MDKYLGNLKSANSRINIHFGGENQEQKSPRKI